MLWADTETYSETPIRNGTYRYASTCELMVFTWAVDDGPVHYWDATDGSPMPEDLRRELENPEQELSFHNAMFDKAVIRYALGMDIPVQRFRCTMVKALAHSLPGSLDNLCGIFRVGADEAKHKEGKALIQLFCKPRPKNSKIRRATRETHPEEWQRFIEYAKADITAMREVAKKIPSWNYQGAELALWHLDQKINDRGFLVDVELAESAIKAVGLEQINLRQQTRDNTDGAVESTTQRDVLLEHILQEYGIDLPDLKKATLERRLDDPDLPDGVRGLIAIRLQASASSTTKYKALINSVNDDNRLRGTIQFCGAARTGRACIAEGTPVTVLTEDGDIIDRRIEHVRLSDKVWDGDEWVSHEGVVYSGVKDVIEHDGVTATREHIVYLNDTTSVTMEQAHSTGTPLWTGNKFT